MSNAPFTVSVNFDLQALELHILNEVRAIMAALVERRVKEIAVGSAITAAEQQIKTLVSEGRVAQELDAIGDSMVKAAVEKLNLTQIRAAEREIKAAARTAAAMQDPDAASARAATKYAEQAFKKRKALLQRKT